MRRRIQRKVTFEGIWVRYTLTLRGRGGLPSIRLLAGGRVSRRRAKISRMPYGKEAAFNFFRKIVRGRVTPCGLFDVYEDFLCYMENKAQKCKENIS